MKLNNIWEKTRNILSRAQDEIVKVSQMGKVQINRSFLNHERNKIYQKLGEMTYELVQEQKVKSPNLERLVSHIDRLTKKIKEIEFEIGELTQVFSVKLDAEENTDSETSQIKKKFSKKRNRSLKKKEG